MIHPIAYPNIISSSHSLKKYKIQVDIFKFKWLLDEIFEVTKHLQRLHHTIIGEGVSTFVTLGIKVQVV